MDKLSKRIMTSIKTKISAWFVWVSTWGFTASAILGVASIFIPAARIANWPLLAGIFLVFIIVGVKSHMGNIVPDALRQGEDAFEIVRNQEEKIK